MTGQRLRAHNERFTAETIDILDLYDNKEASGTQVLITIKID